MAREYWPCYFSYEETCKRLTDEELGRLFRALMHFGATGELPDLVGRESVAFDFIADDISRARDKYDEVCRKRSESARKSAEARKALADTVQQKPNKPSKSKESKEESKEESKDESKVKRFIPPTLDEVRAYCEARGNAVDPQRWMDYYTSNGWKVGKNSMKDWKAAVRTWEQSGYNNAPKKEKDFADLWREMDD